MNVQEFWSGFLSELEQIEGMLRTTKEWWFWHFDVFSCKPLCRETWVNIWKRGKKKKKRRFDSLNKGFQIDRCPLWNGLVGVFPLSPKDSGIMFAAYFIDAGFYSGNGWKLGGIFVESNVSRVFEVAQEGKMAPRRYFFPHFRYVCQNIHRQQFFHNDPTIQRRDQPTIAVCQLRCRGMSCLCDNR